MGNIKQIYSGFNCFFALDSKGIIGWGDNSLGQISPQLQKCLITAPQFIKINMDSNSFKRVIGSNLEFIGERIDSIYKSTTKGTHAKVEQKEAESYVMYTYMLIGDILELYKPKEE